MIVFDLVCNAGSHRFEGWFGSSGDYAAQQERGLVTCPVCGSGDVIKAVMAPAVARKGNQVVQAAPAKLPDTPPSGQPQPMSAGSMPPEAVAMLKTLAKMQAEALKSSKWVGGKFADDARAMHYGEKTVEAIHGQTTPEEARELIEEGIEVAPVLFPLVPPSEAN